MPAGGCAALDAALAPQAPWGAGAATEADLTVYLAGATEAQYEGELMHFLVMPSKGEPYFTWAMTRDGETRGCELDVRDCLPDAELCVGRQVIVGGRLMAREYPHLPLLRVEWILPMPDEGPPPAYALMASAEARHARALAGH